MIRICLHGAESTGKSVLAERLAHEFGCPWVPEFGRIYCEERGTDIDMNDLLAIAVGHEASVRAAGLGNPPMVILDTDPLMTAAWAEILFAHVPNELLAYPKANLYLLFEPDVPWVDDGTRFFGKGPLRARFSLLAEDMLRRAGVSYVRIRGNWDEREAAARSAIRELLPSRCS